MNPALCKINPTAGYKTRIVFGSDFERFFCGLKFTIRENRVAAADAAERHARVAVGMKRGIEITFDEKRKLP